MPPRPRIKFAPGKTYVYSGTEGVYSVIAGELLEGDSVASGGNLAYGNGSPSAGSGKDGDVYLDLTDFKVHTKNGSGWSAGSAFKGTNGTNGSAGTNGKSVRFGSGAPGSGVGDNDDVYFDLTDFKLHTKSAGSWSAGSAFKGTNGSNGAAGVNGKGIKWGNGAPVGSPGDDDDLYFDLDNLQVYPKVSGAWSNAGKKGFRGTDGSSGADGINGTKVLQGVSAPGASDGDNGDTFIDATNHKIYKKTAGSWAEQGSGFKGTNGSNGSNGTNGRRGKTTLEGDGPPGTSTNLATPTAALTAALSDESMTSADLEAGDLYVDTTNHKFYRKTALGWTARTAFKGSDGINGTKVLQGSSAPKVGDGDDGDTFIDATNHVIYKKTAGSWAEQGASFKGSAGIDGKTVLQGSSAPAGATGAVGDTFLDTTTHIVYKKTGSSTWTAQGVSFKGAAGVDGSDGSDGAGVSIYSAGLSADKSLPAETDVQLYFTDVETNLGGIVTATGSSGSGSTFTIATGKAGRYRVDLTVGVKATGTNTSSWTVDGWIEVNDVEKERGQKTGTLAGVLSSITGYKSFTVSFIGYFRVGATIKCFAKRVSTTGTISSLYANAIDKTADSGEDTTITITKL
jgi:hypothetical protein